MISKLGRAVLMVEIGVTDAKTTLKRPSGAPKTSQRWPQNPPKAIFGSKRRANQAQESSKMNLEALFGRSRGPSELPRAAQELPKGARESPRTTAKPFLDRKSWFFNNAIIHIGKSTFSRVGGRFGSSKSTPRGSERKDKMTSTAPEPTQGHLRQQEASKPGRREFQDKSGRPFGSI